MERLNDFLVISLGDSYFWISTQTFNVHSLEEVMQVKYNEPIFFSHSGAKDYPRKYVILSLESDSKKHGDVHPGRGLRVRTHWRQMVALKSHE